MFDPYAPTPDPDAPPNTPQLGALVSGQQTPTVQPTPPATPEQHTNLKQSWLDFFQKPEVSGFLMQFGASMLANSGRPGFGGLGGTIGQAIGEGGEAVGRQQQQDIEQEKQAIEKQKAGTEEEKAAGLTGYYKQEGLARLNEAKAALQNAATNTSKLDLQQQLLDIRASRNEALNAASAAGLDAKTLQLENQRIQLDAETALRKAQAQLDDAKRQGLIPENKKLAIESYYKDRDAAMTLGDTPPDYTKAPYFLSDQDFGGPAATVAPPPPTAGGAPATTKPTAPAPAPTGGFVQPRTVSRTAPAATPTAPAPPAPTTPLGAVKSFSLSDGSVVIMKKNKAGPDTDQNTWEPASSGKP